MNMQGVKNISKQEYLVGRLILAPRHSTIYHLETKYAQAPPQPFKIPSNSTEHHFIHISFLFQPTSLGILSNCIACHFFQFSFHNQTSESFAE